MKTENSVNKTSILFFAIFLSSVFCMNSLAISADTSKLKKDKRSKIRITSNRMNAVSKAKYAEFIGNVKAVQGTFILTSDVLRIYYTENSPKENKPVKKGSISKIIASGNVHIKSEDFTAVSDLALYLTESMVLILKGNNSTITNGENTIVGSKITYYRSDGRVKIEGTTDKRVEAVFYSRKNDKGEYSIIPSTDDKEKQLPSGSSTSLEEKEIAE
jgi:lipopolysaccharide export system protein LptA